MINPKDQQSENTTLLIAASIGIPLLAFFYAQDDPGRGIVASIFAGFFVMAIRRHWHLRHRAWFIVTVAVLGVFHIALLLLIPWVDTGYSGIVLAPMAVPDLLLIYGCIKGVGKLVGEQNLNEPAKLGDQ